jgi:hypothetical protein
MPGTNRKASRSEVLRDAALILLIGATLLLGLIAAVLEPVR